MTRKDKESFSAKHPPNVSIAKEVDAGVTARITEGSISCQTAFELASELSVQPLIIGTAIDLQEGRITHCQLGLFGYDPDKSPLDGVEKVDDDLKNAIQTVLEDGRLTCQNAWQIAKRLRRSRLAVARACESLGVRVKGCQLRAF